MVDTGSRFVAALAVKDTDALIGLFAADVAFRGMTPGRFWEAGSPSEVVDGVLYHWFDSSDVIEEIDYVEVGSVVDRARVDYRFRVRNGDGLFAVEQRAYFDLDDEGRIARMHAMCAGYRLLAAADG